jgi:hypothetical protein
MGDALLHRHLGSAVIAIAVVTTALAAQTASADETVTIGGSRAVLIKPKAVRASVIFMPGDNGAIEAGDHGDIHGLRLNVLIRNRQAYVARGIAVLIADWNTDLKSAVDYMAAIKRPVTVIATSRGTVRAAQGIAQGARPDALVLASGLLSPESGSSSNVMSILGSPTALPRTLVIHHREDGCRLTQPAGVDPFIKWAGGRRGCAGSRAARMKATPAKHAAITATTASTARWSGSPRVSVDLPWRG